MIDAEQAKKDDIPVLPSGELRFRVQHRDGTETVHEVDLLAIKVACEQCETKHKLEVSNGALVPTADFLRELASDMEHLGVADCTPTVAWLIWKTTAEEFAKLKKKLERDAVIAFWFHLDPTQLNTRTKIGLLANLKTVQAQQRIHLGLYEPTDFREMFRLYLEAYGDIDLARQARTRAMELYVERCTDDARRNQR